MIVNNFSIEVARVTGEFISQISKLARGAAVDMVNSAMSSVGAPGISSSGSVARSSSSAVERPPTLISVGLRSARMGRPVGIRGVKRSADDLGRTSESFLSFVASNPGLRIEQINKQLGSSTKDLALPIRKLIASGDVVTKGEKRSTTYFAYAGRGSKPKGK